MCKKSVLSTIVILVAALLLGPSAWGFNANTDPSLVGWWPLDDGRGTVAVDKSPGGHDGDLINGPTWVAGYLGGALEFDGTDDYVDTGWTENLPRWTIAVWVMSPAAPSTAGNPSGPLHRQNNYHFNWDNYNGVTWPGSVAANIGGWNHASLGPLEANTWYHLCGTYDGTEMRAYTNGVLISTVPLSGDPTNEGSSLVLGRHAVYADYFTGTVDEARVYNRALTLKEIQEVMLGGVAPELASVLVPADEETDVERDGTVLSWNPGAYAATHDVYFGDSFDDVNEADRDDPRGVLVSENHGATTFVPDHRLTLGVTYYWRIDEVNAVPADGIFKGPVWRFTVEPVSYPLSGSLITAKASSVNGDPETTTTGPEKTIDGSGLDENDGHSTLDSDMWLNAFTGDAEPWIQYKFDQIYKLDRLLVWNSNQGSENLIGWGAKDVKIETSVDGTTWTVVEGITQLTQAPGETGAGPTDNIALGGIPAKYVRISITDNYSVFVAQTGLSEVRFYYIPVQAREPIPAVGATDVRPDDLLSWRAGREAETHEVFVGTDANAVLDGTAPSQTVTDNRVGLASFDLPIGETYFWKVNEANEAETPSVWPGLVWDFAIPDPLVVDDFESYTNNAENYERVFQTWIDGAGYTNPVTFPGNGTGSYFGYDPTQGDIMEKSIVHGGSQAAPFIFGVGGKSTAEVVRTFDEAQNWTLHGITTLVVHFYGDPENVPGQLYVKINDTKVLFTDDPGAISRTMWEQWNIDLASTGANLSSVQSLTLGIENGSGLVYVDDILLYRNAPAPVEGIDPGNAGLVASYSMENNLNDATGNYHGTAVGSPTYQASYNSSMALALDGIDDYVDLPIGGLIASLSDITVAGWVNSSSDDGWQRVFDFGNDTTVYMFMSVNSGTGTDPMRFAITTGSNGAESGVNGLVALPADWHHVAATIDSSTMTMALYVDGSVVGSGPTALLPQDLGETTQNRLGSSQWDDPLFSGALDDVLIYDRALSEAEARYLAGEQ
jgi:hypothetical protein